MTAADRGHDEPRVAVVRAMFDAAINTAIAQEPDLDGVVRRFDDLPNHLQFSVVRGLSSLVPVIVRVATTPTPKET